MRIVNVNIHGQQIDITKASVDLRKMPAVEAELKSFLKRKEKANDTSNSSSKD